MIGYTPFLGQVRLVMSPIHRSSFGLGQAVDESGWKRRFTPRTQPPLPGCVFVSQRITYGEEPPTSEEQKHIDRGWGVVHIPVGSPSKLPTGATQYFFDSWACPPAGPSQPMPSEAPISAATKPPEATLSPSKFPTTTILAVGGGLTVAALVAHVAGAFR